MSRRPQLIVFTDLDNTLLDHDSYSYEPALPVLATLRQRAIPVIPATSKTLAEMDVYQTKLALDGPCISENGSLIRIPAGPLAATPARRILGVDRATILEHLQRLRGQGYRFVGFSDMSVRALMTLTQLDHASAIRAMERQASEPLLWEGSPAELDAFDGCLRAAGLKVVRGGRFLHVMGACDKADAVRFLTERYRPCWPEQELVTVALGDSPNDRDMLAAADIAIIMGEPATAAVHAKGRRQTLYAGGGGPVFWASAMGQLLSQYGLSEERAL